ncbi:TPA: hypothetical protein VJR80_000872 [Streptococcus pyogenes]|nr:hypothetical protein [Streptococcus pyogenes]
MKKKLSLFMIATAAVVGLSLATPENQTVSASETKAQACLRSPGLFCCPKVRVLPQLQIQKQLNRTPTIRHRLCLQNPGHISLKPND